VTTLFFTFIAASLLRSEAQTPTVAEPRSVEEAMPLYLRFRDGTPGDPELFQKKVRDYSQASERFFDQSPAVKSASNDRCGVFLDTYQSIHQQAAVMMGDLSQGDLKNTNFYLSDPLHLARLQILISLASIFKYMLNRDAEAGAGVLEDREGRVQCTVPDRASWKRQGEAITTLLSDAGLALTGAPGIRDMETIETSLARKIEKKERDNSHRLWTSIGVGSVISIFVWEMAPLLGLRYLSAVPGVRTRIGFFSLKFFGIGTELALFKYADRHFLFVEDSVLEDQTQMISWDDFQKGVQAVLRSEVNSPRFYYDALTQLYGRLSAEMLNILGPWEGVLSQIEDRTGSIDRALQQQTNLKTSSNEK
jgi:hypothetical protein